MKTHHLHGIEYRSGTVQGHNGSQGETEGGVGNREVGNMVLGNEEVKKRRFGEDRIVYSDPMYARGKDREEGSQRRGRVERVIRRFLRQV